MLGGSHCVPVITVSRSLRVATVLDQDTRGVYDGLNGHDDITVMI